MRMIIVVLILSLFSCSLFYPVDYLNLSSYEAIKYYIKSNIKYKSDNVDFWQYPWDTINKRTGDCEDMAILFLWLSYKNFGEKGKLVMSLNSKGSLHAYAVVDKIIFNKINNYRDLYTINYDFTFYICDLYNTILN